MLTMDEYFSLTSSLLLAFGGVFELPLLLSVLSMLGIVTPRGLWRFNRYAILIFFVLGAFLTPGDMIGGQIAMGLALTVLYNLSILVSLVFARRRKRRSVPGEPHPGAGDSGGDGDEDDAVGARGLSGLAVGAREEGRGEVALLRILGEACGVGARGEDAALRAARVRDGGEVAGGEAEPDGETEAQGRALAERDRRTGCDRGFRLGGGAGGRDLRRRRGRARNRCRLRPVEGQLGVLVVGGRGEPIVRQAR
jgi:hypothetical protein